MKDGNAYIVMVQRSAGVLEMTNRYALRKMEQQGNKNHLVCTLDAAEAMEEVRREPVDIVITSQELDNSKGSYVDGVVLSEMINLESPDIMVIRYSGGVMMGDTRGHIAADVEKPGDNPAAVIDFIASPNLADILRTQDWEKMKKEHPNFTFYDDVLEQLTLPQP